MIYKEVSLETKDISYMDDTDTIVNNYYIRIIKGKKL